MSPNRVLQGWTVNEWAKKAVLLSFLLQDNQVIESGDTRYFDKVPGKFDGFAHSDFVSGGYRVVPPAMVRRGVYLGQRVVLMPSYVNIGAYVDDGTMVDTWATVGSCAQIGKNVHLSGGVGIGGVLEPLQASPTIIEDDCFIGARSEVVEGVIVERGSVLSMGVYTSAKAPDSSSRDRRNHLRSSACRIGRRLRIYSCQRSHPQSLLRGHCQASRREDPRKSRHQ